MHNENKQVIYMVCSSVDVNHGIYMATPHILNWEQLGNTLLFTFIWISYVGCMGHFTFSCIFNIVILCERNFSSENRSWKYKLICLHSCWFLHWKSSLFILHIDNSFNHWLHEIFDIVSSAFVVDYWLNCWSGCFIMNMPW
jgi:hypothetical protein